ncbi:SCO6745 family protein [Nocardioides ultimimeridianus]
MTSPPTRPDARDLWRLLEPLHAVTYFSPEPLAALRAAGFRGFWMGYFAGRAAPLGPVGPAPVRALFYNFAPARVEGALPDAWTFGTPEAALDARLRGSVAALERILGDAVEVTPAAELARRAALAAPPEGRPLYAANAALPWPTDPLAVLWHAATLLREHRGDGHIAALQAHGIGGRDSHVLRSAVTGVPRETYTVARDFTDAEWRACTERLAERGLLGPDGLTAAGRETAAVIEQSTDRLAASAYDALGDDELVELAGLLEPLTAAVVASGEIPAAAPMGLRLDRS